MMDPKDQKDFFFPLATTKKQQGKSTANDICRKLDLEMCDDDYFFYL